MFSRNLEILKKMREDGTIKYYSCNCYIYSSVTGEFKVKFDSQKECAIYTGISEHIVGKCIKRNQSFNEFIFSSTWLGDKVDASMFKQKKRLMFAVFKIDPNTRSVVSSYNSPLEAAKDNGVSNVAIYNAITKNIKSNGFFWAKENLINGEPLIKSDKVCKKFKPVFCYLDNPDTPVMKFISIRRAASHFGCTDENIGRAVKTNATAVGYYWMIDKTKSFSDGNN
jgi:hypothetical protein